MQLFAPDILVDAGNLSVPLILTTLLVGFALWLFGWRTHRFWLVLFTTVLGGLIGLSEAGNFGVQPIVAALLLAVSAGVLALALVRLLAFFAGGLAGLWTVASLAPGWDQPFIGFLVCGLIGLFLFRLWIMALTSLSGTILMGYAGLCLAQYYGHIQAPAWAADRTELLTISAGILALLGLFIQFVVNRKVKSKSDASDSDDSQDYFLHPILGLYRKAG
jgi:hypothetical protein